MNITILSIDIKTIPTAKGSYQTAEVAYKNNTYQGKVEGKKIMSFGASANTFKVLATAASGDSFNVEVVKNDKGYNDWVSLTKGGVDAAPAAKPAGTVNGVTIPMKSNYETSEERAQRQVYIIKQSSLTSAIAAMSVGGKAALKPEDVVNTAKVFVDYVLGMEKKDPGPSGFEDLPDFPVAE